MAVVFLLQLLACQHGTLRRIGEEINVPLSGKLLAAAVVNDLKHGEHIKEWRRRQVG